MRRLSMTPSIMTVIIASWALRQGVRVPERKRFFESCCEIVDPPATTLPRFWFFSQAFCIASQSKPSWSANFASSAATMARLRFGEMRA